ncbi:B3 domain-containing protein Os08g0324300-like [Apium graveolens]|uniref:B3 domain-containing protein Os08g0324300-like n=1 Tax=Apium graveolens TaxID=4045 RepID=UPI003D7B2419
MDLTPKFGRRVRLSECSSNEIRVPHAFCLKYDGRIPATLKIIVRNGYEIWVDFDKVNEKFKGFREFYHDFGIISGNTLLFEYVGNFDMKVVIVDMYGSEIQYPHRVHELQKQLPNLVSIYDGG